MKTRKRFLAVLLIAVFAVLSLTGCHGSRGRAAFQVPEQLDESAKIELTFWAKNDTNKTQTTIYEKAISDFEALYPNIKVNMRLYTDYGKIYNDVITNIATNTTPNICITYPDHIATYMTGDNVVVPLDSLMGDERYGLAGSELKFDAPSKDEIVPQFLSECAIGGTTYALPYMRSTEACYVNKTFVEKLGYELPDVLTWDFVWEVSEAATKKGADGNFAVNGQKVMIPFIDKSTDNMMIQMLKQRDAGYSTDSGEVELFNDTTKEIVRMFPQYDPENPRMISQGPSICIFNKEDPQIVLASWLFTQYLISNDVQIAYSQTEGYVPVTTKAQNAAEYQDYLSRSGEDNNLYYDVKISAAKLLIDNVQYTFVTPVFNGSTSLRDAAGQLIENVTKSVRRKATVDDAYLKNLFSEVTALYRLDQTSMRNQGTEGGDKDMGPLPTASKALLITLGVTWVLIGAYYIRERMKASKNN